MGGLEQFPWLLAGGMTAAVGAVSGSVSGVRPIKHGLHEQVYQTPPRASMLSASDLLAISLAASRPIATMLLCYYATMGAENRNREPAFQT